MISSGFWLITPWFTIHVNRWWGMPQCAALNRTQVYFPAWIARGTPQSGTLRVLWIRLHTDNKYTLKLFTLERPSQELLNAYYSFDTLTKTGTSIVGRVKAAFPTDGITGKVRYFFWLWLTLYLLLLLLTLGLYTDREGGRSGIRNHRWHRCSKNVLPNYIYSGTSSYETSEKRTTSLHCTQ